MVTITGIGNDTCELTGKDGEGIYCEFTKGSDFRGFVSWASLKQLVVMHANQKPIGDASNHDVPFDVINDVN